MVDAPAASPESGASARAEPLCESQTPLFDPDAGRTVLVSAEAGRRETSKAADRPAFVAKA
jgi:hypothetical protein